MFYSKILILPLIALLLLFSYCTMPNSTYTEQATSEKKSLNNRKDSLIYFTDNEQHKIYNETYRLYVSDMSYKGKYPIVDSTRKDSVVYYSSTFEDYPKCLKKYAVFDDTNKDTIIALTTDSIRYQNSKLMIDTYFFIETSIYQKPYGGKYGVILDKFTANENYTYQILQFPIIVKQLLRFYDNMKLCKEVTLQPILREDARMSLKKTNFSYLATDVCNVLVLKGANDWFWCIYGIGNGRQDESTSIIYDKAGNELSYFYHYIMWEDSLNYQRGIEWDTMVKKYGLPKDYLEDTTHVINVADFDYPNK